MSFKKAEKYKSKLRAALFGASGSGKTYSALSIASGIADRINTKIAVIDSEHGSAQKYADRFSFDIVELENKTIDEYISYINEASKAGYGVLIIDSTSHAWSELLEEVDKIGKTKFKGNSWAAWQEGTPKQKKFIDAILSYDGHIIVTMRSKTEWQTTDTDGKKCIKRLGLAPEQGKGIEYEFDLLLELSTDHMAEIIKDRTGKFQDKIIDKPGVSFGKELVDWLNTGIDKNKSEPTKTEKQVKQSPLKESVSMDDLKLEAEIVSGDIPVSTDKYKHTNSEKSNLNEAETIHKDLCMWQVKGLIPDRITFTDPVMDGVKEGAKNIITFLERPNPESYAEKWEKAKKIYSAIKIAVEQDIF